MKKKMCKTMHIEELYNDMPAFAAWLQEKADGYLELETKATDPDNPEGKDVQNRANDSGEQKGMGEGKD
jgi:type II secretory pathway component PulM